MIFFLNLAHLSRVSPFDVTYEGVAPCALARLASMVASGVAHQFNCVGVIGATHGQVMSVQVARLSHAE
jgi:hypothetical protein